MRIQWKGTTVPDLAGLSRALWESACFNPSGGAKLTARTCRPLNPRVPSVTHHKDGFENEVLDFLFFMDGNTVAKHRFERLNGRLFPIVQQTFVLPADRTAEFAQASEDIMRERSIRPTESDMFAF